MTDALSALPAPALTPGAWEERIRGDGRSASSLLPQPLHDLHTAVVSRARDAGAHSLILSGSTARGRRTEISDLDYHLVGRGFTTRDLSAELDLHVLSPEELRAKVLDGDDFVHWSIRFGLVLFDNGTLLSAARMIAERSLWPGVERKARHAGRSLDLAGRVVATGDADGALVQVRTALSLAARAHLLAIGRFPLSRAELPGQLLAAGRPDAAAALEDCVHHEPSLEALARAVANGYALLESAPALGSEATPRVAAP